MQASPAPLPTPARTAEVRYLLQQYGTGTRAVLHFTRKNHLDPLITINFVSCALQKKKKKTPEDPRDRIIFKLGFAGAMQLKRSAKGKTIPFFCPARIHLNPTVCHWVCWRWIYIRVLVRVLQYWRCSGGGEGPAWMRVQVRGFKIAGSRTSSALKTI